MLTASKPEVYRTQIERTVQETPGVRTFRFRLPKGAELSFIPGQWVMVSDPASPEVNRAYSLSSSPLDRGAVEITAAAVGDFSTWLFGLKPGDPVLVKGPFGKWVYTEDAAHAVLVSGGTGITPFRSIARYVAEKGLENRLTILYSSRTPSHMLFREELDLLGRRPNIKVFHTVTRPADLRPGERWDGPVGRIGVETIRRFVPDLAEATYFMCGPSQLIRELAPALEAQGVPKARIRYEKWGEF